MWAGAQIRPTTGPTTLLEDAAGTFLPSGHTARLDEALATGGLVEEQLEKLPDGH